MTNSISKYRQREDGQDFTPKDSLVNVPLLVTGAKKAKGRIGEFVIVEATRQDTNAPVVFSGSKVIDQLVLAAKEADGFPVTAMLVKVEADNPQGYYWDLTDPPEAPTPPVERGENGAHREGPPSPSAPAADAVPEKDEQTRYRRRMFAIGKEMGLTADDLKPLMQSRFKKQSSTELTHGEWDDFLAFLNGLKELGATKVTELVEAAKADNKEETPA
jgi:hypothetical protein